MTPAMSNATQVETPTLEKVISYLQRTGWSQISHPNQKLIIFQGPIDDLNRPIQVVLPQSTRFWDSSILLTKAIDLLANIKEKTPDEIRTEIQLEKDLNQVFFESSSEPLTGKALLQKLKELSYLPKQELAKQAGYYTITKDNQTLVNLTDFYDALLAAKGINLNPKIQENSRSRKPNHRVSVNKNGQIVIPANYIRAMRLKPGDELEVKLISKQILLSPIQRT